VSAWQVTGHTYNEGTRYSILSLTLIKIFPPVLRVSGHPNPWSRVLLEKSAIPQPDKKFFAFYDTRRSITAFTNSQPLDPILSHVKLVHALPNDLYVLISSSGLNLGLSSSVFLQSSPPTPCMHPSSLPYVCETGHISQKYWSNLPVALTALLTTEYCRHAQSLNEAG